LARKPLPGQFRYRDFGNLATIGRRVAVVDFGWLRLTGRVAWLGHVNRLRIRADQPGRYEGLCNQFCGLGHPGMRFVVIVHTAEDFAAALAQAAAPAKGGQ
jgi:hypothetical protein